MQIDEHPIFKKSYSGFLFDMDGTLINSVVAAERVWGSWAAKHGLDVQSFLPTIHGVRIADTIRNLQLPDIDIEAETEWVMQGEVQDVEGIVPIEGALRFLAAIPEDRWTIVTSATKEIARARLNAAGIKPPKCLVTAEEVSNGKPEPDCFILGANRLGVDIRNCLIFEDALAGITAAERAGCDVFVVTGANPHPLDVSHFKAASYRNFGVSTLPRGELQLMHTGSDITQSEDRFVLTG